MTKFYGASKLTQETLDKINSDIHETINNYYRHHEAEDFFKIVYRIFYNSNVYYLS